MIYWLIVRLSDYCFYVICPINTGLSRAYWMYTEYAFPSGGNGAYMPNIVKFVISL